MTSVRPCLNIGKLEETLLPTVDRDRVSKFIATFLAQKKTQQQHLSNNSDQHTTDRELGRALRRLGGGLWKYPKATHVEAGY